MPAEIGHEGPRASLLAEGQRTADDECQPPRLALERALPAVLEPPLPQLASQAMQAGVLLHVSRRKFPCHLRQPGDGVLAEHAAHGQRVPWRGATAPN